MVKFRKRKMSNRRKRFLILNSFLLLFLFFGMGYSTLFASLNIGGDINLNKYVKPTLYNVIKNEYDTNGLAGKYTGSHQDSMDVAKSTEDIYYFSGDVREKYNVVFANMCWQMIRTTDTGGVRMIYNGEPTVTEVDGVKHYDCGDTRPHHMGNVTTTQNLNGTKLYGKGYTTSVSGDNTTFTLTDTASIEVTSSDALDKITYIKENYPYTCNNTTGTCQNEALYKVDSQSSGTTATVYKSTYRDAIGVSAFNTNYNSPTYVGYMYGDVYSYQYNLVGTTSQSLTSSQNVYNTTLTLSTSYYYADTIDWNTTTANSYTLLSPTQITSETDYSSLAGKYVINNTTNSTSVYYIVGIYNTNRAYVKTLSSGNLDVSMRFADNLTSTGELDNPTSPVELKDWYTNYNDYKEKYTCGDSSTTCTTPIFITNTTATNYTYMAGNITISKTRSGLELTTPETIDYGKWYKGYNTTYNDYVYTCGDTSTTCTEANLRYITAKTATNYTYAPNHYFGKSVKYENNKYKLQDTVDLEKAVDMASLSTHHYACVNPGLKECASVAYVYYYSGSGSMYYITLNDEDITSAQDALDAMFTKNTTNSTIKTLVDSWYQKNILNTVYESKIEDTIYCNDRSYPETEGTFASSGWNDNGGYINKYLYFKDSVNNTDLSCRNDTDKFSTSNDDAKLIYPVGLMTLPEVNMLGNSNARKSHYYYWLASPYNFHNNFAYGRYVYSSGVLHYNYIGNAYGARPAVSLSSSTMYESGSGKSDDPYVVKMD